MKDLTIEAVKKNYKRYLLSSFVTFLTGFAIVLVADMDSLTYDSIRTGGIAGLFFAGFRAGFKAVLEFFISSTGDK